MTLIADIPLGWQSGDLVIGGEETGANVKLADGRLRIEAQRELVEGQTFEAYGVDWRIVSVEPREHGVFWAVAEAEGGDGA
jgi:hypothetical protein